MGCSSSIHAAPPSAAGDAAQQGTKPQPVTPDSRLLRGQAYYAAGKVAEALKEFNATISTWPTYARAYLERGNVRLDQQDYTLALGDYTMALQLQGNLLQAYLMRCHARMGLRQLTEAMQDVKAAERLDPDNAQVRALKAQVRKAQAGGGTSPGSQGACADDDDAFAGMDTPKSTPSPSVRKLCMVCMDSERECRLRPCMHAALCVDCAEGLMARGYGCPICSSKIEQVERGAFMRTFTVEEAQGIVASARIVATMPSPGKSPLGRRFAPGGGPPGAPFLDNIVEVDEEAHATADAADAAAAQRALSIDSGASSVPAAPTVLLDPHPLATRAQSASRRGGGGGGALGEGGGAADLETPPTPTLPGVVMVLEEEGGSGADASDVTRAGSTDRFGSTSATDGGCTTSAAGGGGAGDSDGDGEGSPGALSAVASAYMANSLADWIDVHQDADTPRNAAPPPAAAPPPPRTPPTPPTPPLAAAAASQSRPRGESFVGFASSGPASATAAGGPGPVAEGRCRPDAAAGAHAADCGVVGRVFFHGAPPWRQQSCSARSLAVRADPLVNYSHLTECSCSGPGCRASESGSRSGSGSGPAASSLQCLRRAGSFGQGRATPYDRGGGISVGGRRDGCLGGGNGAASGGSAFLPSARPTSGSTPASAAQRPPRAPGILADRRLTVGNGSWGRGRGGGFVTAVAQEP